MHTATYLYADEDACNEFQCTLAFDVQPAEPEVGIMSGSVEVTACVDVDGVHYIDGVGAEFKPPADPKTGWESKVMRKVMHLYATYSGFRNSMEGACFESLEAERQLNGELRAEAAQERRNPFYSRLTG